MTLSDKLNLKCAKQTTIAIIENNGKYWIGTNWCKNPQEECPRKDLPTGVGYEKCNDICNQQYHAEEDACIEAGDNAKGGKLILFGHYYCCSNCKAIMDKNGITQTIIAGGKI